jgi:hypothetical protein
MGRMLPLPIQRKRRDIAAACDKRLTPYFEEIRRTVCETVLGGINREQVLNDSFGATRICTPLILH